MKTKSSHYILVVEIITIILFHAVKIRQAEKHPAELAFSRTSASKSLTLPQPAKENKSGVEFMLVNLTK
jgi:hypothetical protein